MGYESKIYIVEKQISINDEGKIYAQVIAMFDMCKFYSLSNVLRDKPITDCYFYADDDNTQVMEDKYGKPLTEATVRDVTDILEDEVADGNDYRRIFPLLSTLKTIEQQQRDGRWKNVVVLHYGY